MALSVNTGPFRPGRHFEGLPLDHLSRCELTNTHFKSCCKSMKQAKGPFNTMANPFSEHQFYGQSAPQRRFPVDAYRI